MAERMTDQERKDLQNQQVEEARRQRAERLGHDIREVTEKPRRRQNIYDALKPE